MNVAEFVEEGETLLYIYKNDKWEDRIIDDLYKAYEFSDKYIEPPKVIEEIVS